MMCLPPGAPGQTVCSGAAAHRGADCRLRAGGPAARCSCAADGGQVGGCAEDRRPLRPRAGDRSAQDVKPFLSSSSSSGFSCAAVGGTAGGCATAGRWSGAGMGLRCQWPGLVTHLGLFGANQLVAPGLRPRPVEHPARDYRQPRAVYKYWARMRIFYGPLFLAVTCSVLVCLRSTCVDFSGRRLLDLFPCSALLGPTVVTCFFLFTEALYSDPAIDSRPALFCFRTQRTAWSSVVHVMRQSTEWSNFMFSIEKVDYGS